MSFAGDDSATHCVGFSKQIWSWKSWHFHPSDLPLRPISNVASLGNLHVWSGSGLPPQGRWSEWMTNVQSDPQGSPSPRQEPGSNHKHTHMFRVINLVLWTRGSRSWDHIFVCFERDFSLKRFQDGVLSSVCGVSLVSTLSFSVTWSLLLFIAFPSITWLHTNPQLSMKVRGEWGSSDLFYNLVDTQTDPCWSRTLNITWSWGHNLWDKTDMSDQDKAYKFLASSSLDLTSTWSSQSLPVSCIYCYTWSHGMKWIPSLTFTSFLVHAYIFGFGHLKSSRFLETYT